MVVITHGLKFRKKNLYLAHNSRSQLSLKEAKQELDAKAMEDAAASLFRPGPPAQGTVLPAGDRTFLCQLIRQSPTDRLI